MAVPRLFPAAAFVAGRLYVCGGEVSHRADTVFNSAELLDPATGEWRPARNLPSGRSQAPACAGP